MSGWSWRQGVLLIALGMILIAEAPASSRQRLPGRLQEAVDLLMSVPSGRLLVARAQSFWKFSDSRGLVSVLRWGAASRTDAVLTRHFDPKSGQEVRSREVVIYLRADQPVSDLALDIAHELVHATARPGWDPYDPALSAGHYVRESIEGEGGEVEAVIAECAVLGELAGRFGGAPSDRCTRYWQSPTELRAVRDKVRADFYRVGNWHDELITRLGDEASQFSALSSDSPKLFSSTAGTPYPVALLREYEEILQVACENSKRRAASFAQRKPASEALTAVEKGTLTFVTQKCR